MLVREAMNVKKILLTGAGGFVGMRIVQHLQGRYELITFPKGVLSRADLSEIRAFVMAAAPDAIIHTAAIADMGVCEANPEDSWRSNVLLTETLCSAAQELRAKIVCYSSDQVYNGCDPLSGPYCEDIPLTPVNVYGRHKLEAEQRALRNLPDAVGLRLTWMYDLPDSRMRQNTGLPLNLLNACREANVVRAATHECRGVTYVWDVVRNIEKALALPGGIYNFGCGNALSSHALFLAFARAMNLSDPDRWILPDADRFAAQPRNLVMDGTRAASHGIHFPDSTAGFREALCHPFRTP